MRVAFEGQTQVSESLSKTQVLGQQAKVVTVSEDAETRRDAITSMLSAKFFIALNLIMMILNHFQKSK